MGRVDFAMPHIRRSPLTGARPRAPGKLRRYTDATDEDG